MKSRIWWIGITVVLACLCGVRLTTSSVTAQEDEGPREELDEQDYEHLERQVDEIQRRIERAEDEGKEELVRDLRREAERIFDQLERLERENGDDDEADEELEERERHERELEMHRQELEIRRATIEIEVAEFELRTRRFKWLSDERASALNAIEMAAHLMEPEESVEFFGDLLGESTDPVVKRALQQRLVELNFQLDRRDDAKAQLRALILHGDE